MKRRIVAAVAAALTLAAPAGPATKPRYVVALGSAQQALAQASVGIQHSSTTRCSRSTRRPARLS
jgi:hypothetical protein